MKKIIISLILITVVSTYSFAQETKEDFKPSGEVLFKVFWNYHYDFTQNATKTSAFELDRSYFGYKYDFSKAISAKITFDVGSNTGGSEYTAFLKVAQLDWKVTKGVKLSMGLIGLKQFNDQEDFWGYRYLAKSFQDEYGFGTSADLGINAEFTLAKNLKANFLIINGEGYKAIQDADGNQKIGGSLVYTPVKGLTTKIYADNQPTTGGDDITTYSFFAGYKAVDWRLGAEYNMQNNATKYASPAPNKDLDGFSFYTTYAFDKKWEIFGRFDQLGSNTLVGDAQDWNYDKNGSKYIFGVQVAPVKGLKFALNYQGFTSDNSALDTKSLVFLNAEFKL
ncbi:MAG: hypothetical protein JJE44_07035 [Flavobacteriaceae bacterium]|nr:hypothetical protein [Flavobacteriaceae bacterium]